MIINFDANAYFNDNSDNQNLIIPIVTPEQKLMRAVLCRAILDAKSTRSQSGMNKTHNKIEALEWFYNDLKPNEEKFTFNDILQALSNNPQELKKAIIKFIESPRKIKNKMNFFNGSTSIYYDYHKKNKGRNNEFAF